MQTIATTIRPYRPCRGFISGPGCQSDHGWAWQTAAVSDMAQVVQGYLLDVASERARRTADPLLALRVQEIKRFQHARFSSTYGDLLADPASGKAARFFLDELYGPMDFVCRDEQFSRVAPKVSGLFPGEIGRVVLGLARLHALSERLDTEMGAVVTRVPLDSDRYARAWRSVGQPAARSEQIELVREIGLALAKQVRKPLIRTTLRLMRGPAKAAGLDSLQAFLEAGFDAFRGLQDASGFVMAIADREMQLAAALFSRPCKTRFSANRVTSRQATPPAAGQGWRVLQS